MAFILPSSFQAQPTPGTPIATAVPTGGQGGAVATASTKPGVAAPLQPKSSLADYLNANAKQASDFANGIVANLQGINTGIQQGIQNGANIYSSSLYSVPTDAQVNSAVATSPSKLTPTQASTYSQELGAAQKAPNSAGLYENSQNYGGLTSQIQNAVQNANQWNVPNNTAQLQIPMAAYEPPQATAGDKTLDAYLLGNTPAAYNNIQSAVQSTEDLPSLLSNSATTADAQLQNAIQSDNAATQAAQGAANTYATNLNNWLTSNLPAFQSGISSQNGAQYAALQSALQDGTLTPAQLAELGLTSQQASALALNPETSGPLSVPSAVLANYLTQGSLPTATYQNELTPQNYSDIAALKSLLGGNLPQLDVSPTPPSSSFNPNAPYTFNYDNALADVNQFNAANAGNEAYANAASLTQQVANLQSQANAAYSNYVKWTAAGDTFNANNAKQLWMNLQSQLGTAQAQLSTALAPYNDYISTYKVTPNPSGGYLSPTPTGQSAPILPL